MNFDELFSGIKAKINFDLTRKNNSDLNKMVGIAKSMSKGSQYQLYFYKRRGVFRTAFYAAIFFMIVSGLSATVGAYIFFRPIIAYTALLLIGSVIFFMLFEVVKRTATRNMWREVFMEKNAHVGWISLNIILFVIAVSPSGYGTFQGVQEFSAPAELVFADSMKNDIDAKIAANKATIAHNETVKVKEHGVWVQSWPAQKANERLAATNEKLEIERQEYEEILKGNREVLSQEHANMIALRSKLFLALIILFEFSLEGCVAYEHYYYSVVIEDIKILYKKGILPESVINKLPDEILLEVEELIDNTIQHRQNESKAFEELNEEVKKKQQAHQRQADLGLMQMPDGVVANQENNLPFFRTDNFNQQLPKRSSQKSLYKSVQTRTDINSIEYRYQRGGREHITYFTETQLNAKIAQYTRDKKKVESQILKNEDITKQPKLDKKLTTAINGFNRYNGLLIKLKQQQLAAVQSRSQTNQT